MPQFWFIYSYLAPRHHVCPDLALSVYMFQYLALFTSIYPHFALFAHIWFYVTCVCVSEENLFEYEIIERSNDLTMDKFIAGRKMPNNKQ